MLRIAETHPPLWRSPSTLQFGPDRVAELDVVDAWHLPFVRALERGIPDTALGPLAESLGAPAGAAASLVRTLAPALEGDSPAPPDPPVVLVPDAAGPAVDRALAGLALAGMAAARRTTDSHDVGDRGPVVVIAHHVLEPRRVAPLIAADVPHVPIVFTTTGAVVGPRVVPGTTACLTCTALDDLERDAAWPAVAGQLLALPAPRVDDAVAVEAGIVAARLLRSTTSGISAASVSLSLAADRVPHRRRVHRPHPACGCRSPEGTGMVADPVALAPRTARVLARPA